VSSGRLVIPQRIFGVIGPTAAGKTSLALRLAELLGGEIVCCDALQVRAGLPILTAKATEAELQRAPHHLLGIFPCDQPATAAQYAQQADLAIADIARRGRAVILCGGTGLYLRALRDGLFAGPGGDPELRSELRAQAEREGISSLHARLVAIDPSAAQRIGPTDYVRIERALEVFTLTGRPISDWQKDSQVERAQGPRYDIALLGVDPGPEVLHRRIARRAAAMLDAGLVQEVRDSLQQDGTLKYPPLGYELVRRHLIGELSLGRVTDGASAEDRSVRAPAANLVSQRARRLLDARSRARADSPAAGGPLCGWASIVVRVGRFFAGSCLVAWGGFPSRRTISARPARLFVTTSRVQKKDCDGDGPGYLSRAD
jgi:tRNA dimethylallyltransferase